MINPLTSLSHLQLIRRTEHSANTGFSIPNLGIPFRQTTLERFNEILATASLPQFHNIITPSSIVRDKESRRCSAKME